MRKQLEGNIGKIISVWLPGIPMPFTGTLKSMDDGIMEISSGSNSVLVVVNAIMAIRVG